MVDAFIPTSSTLEPDEESTRERERKRKRMKGENCEWKARQRSHTISEKRKRDRERESMVDLHLSCIIAANASAAILASETM